MDFFFFIFIFFTIFVLCSLCGFCCRKKDEGAIFTTPVIVTSATHQAPGQIYPIQTNQTAMPVQQPMPMPYPVEQQPMYPGYPSNNAAPAPYPTQPIAPYPPTGAAPYPPQPQQPYPAYPPQQMQQPPSYSDVVMGQQQEGYQKQSPYNPSYGQN